MNAIAIEGVSSVPLKTHVDARGCLTEYFRGYWKEGFQPVQWSVATSNRNVLRGMHVHLQRVDYLFVLHGEMKLGLCDIRPDSPSFMKSWIGEISFERPQAWLIPPGVAHGFYAPRGCTYTIGTSTYWSMDDEFSFSWDDPDLALDWGATQPELSSRDANSGSLQQLLQKMSSLQPSL